MKLAPLDLLQSRAILKVNQTCQVWNLARGSIFGRAVGRIEPVVMIPSDDDFDGMWLGAEPVELSVELGNGSKMRDVTCMDQDIAIRDCHSLTMGVSDTDETDSGLILRRMDRACSQEEDEVVELYAQVNQRRRYQIVQNSIRLPDAAATKAESRKNPHRLGLDEEVDKRGRQIQE